MIYESEVESDQEAKILSIVRHAGEISRLELGQRAGLSRNTLSARLRPLVDRRLIREVGVGASKGGRPPGLIRYAKDAGYLVGVDLGATSLDVAVTNLDAEPIVRRSLEVDVREGPDVIMPIVTAEIEAALGRPGIDRSQVKGIGMGLPGPVEFTSGRPVSPPIMPGWHLYPVRGLLEAEFNRPVYVDNDVNVMALGERWAGLGRDRDNFIFVKLGSGIGCGIFCRGEIYRGSDGSAGDIGHIAVGDNSTVCRCGNVGCLEAIAGGWALGRTAERLAQEGLSANLARRAAAGVHLKSEHLAAALGEGDPVVTEIVRQSGHAIGRVLAGLVNFYDPSMIVIGGGVAKLGDLLLASIRETVYRRSLPLATRNIVIQPGALGDDVGTIGAAALVLTELYQLTPSPL